MPKAHTAFQKLSRLFGGENYRTQDYSVDNAITQDSNILFTTKDKDEYDMKSLQAKQQNLLARQWKRAQYDITNKSLAGLNNIKMMYRDADLMDDFPEIGTALDIVSEEACYIPNSGFMINVTSKSERIKSILNDLFINRLSINTMLPMICRGTCKYGNHYMLLNIDGNNGVKGWKQLPVYEIERYENGMDNPYANAYNSLSSINLDKEDSTKFVWVGQNEFIPYRNWQICHFRLLYDGRFLPYGMSFLNKARRHFRMLSMMEDMMLIYRLERSIERRVFKINVGAIDDADVPAYVQNIADNFKRTPVVDPMTGQLDLKKNLLNVSEDFFIPVRDDNATNPIETLSAAQNLTAMDDIEFIQKKLFTALRVPKSFMNYEEAQGDGKNLSILDIRFTRTTNRIQQALLMELYKVAIIHLYLLGFVDELNNFSITMNNPSSQAEMLELDNMAKKVTTAKDAITDGGNGIPLMSVTRAWKQIMKWSDKEIEENLEELRLEKALAAELEKTNQIIQRTGIFDSVDNIYGEPDAEYGQSQEGEEGQEGGAPMGGGGGSIGGMDFGDEMESPDEGDFENGAEGEMDMETAAGEDNMEMPESEGASDESAGGNLGEKIMSDMLKKVINERKQVQHNLNNRAIYYQKKLSERLNENSRKKMIEQVENIPLYDKAFMINEELNSIVEDLKKLED